MTPPGSRVGRLFRVSSRCRVAVPRPLAVLMLVCVAGAAGCGKKGPPLAPLVRIPEPVVFVATRRAGADVVLTVRVPAKNLDGSTPVDVTSVDLMAVTATRQPPRAVFLERGRRVATIGVASGGAVGGGGASSPEPRAPGPDVSAAPGDEVTVRETLTDEMFTPVSLPPATPAPSPPVSSDVRPAATPAAPEPEARRYYLAVATGSRQRPAPGSSMSSVSLAQLPGVPAAPRVAYTERTLTVSWTSVEGATAYNLYRETREDAAPDQAPAAVTPARPVNATPLATAEYSEPVQFDALACFRVRALRETGTTESLEGLASQATCERPRDTFAPAAPVDLRVFPGAGEITLVWVENSEPDLAGYLVLRGTAGDDTLQPITAAPVAGARFVDRNVTPGVRYAYAVVAVDAASNRSASSMRDETTAR